MLKPDELLVGSGDGNVCVVKDQTLKPSLFKKPSHDGIPKKITEPTKPCLVEVWIFFSNTSATAFKKKCEFFFKGGKVHHFVVMK